MGDAISAADATPAEEVISAEETAAETAEPEEIEETTEATSAEEATLDQDGLNPEQLSCPHCEGILMAFEIPEESGWEGSYQLACFNDECPYYQRGWEWMEQKYGVKASYRYRVEPNSGRAMPLAVWSRTAMRTRIVGGDGDLGETESAETGDAETGDAETGSAETGSEGGGAEQVVDSSSDVDS